MFLGAEQIAAIFNSEGNVRLQQIAVYGIRLYFIATAFAGFNIITSIYFTSIDRARPGNAVSLLRGVVLIVPLAFLMSATLGQNIKKKFQYIQNYVRIAKGILHVQACMDHIRISK